VDAKQKDKHIHKYIHDCINMYIFTYVYINTFVIVGLFEGIGGGERGKNDNMNNINIHHMYEDDITELTENWWEIGKEKGG
jgi:hypothetical protein